MAISNMLDDITFCLVDEGIVSDALPYIERPNGTSPGNRHHLISLRLRGAHYVATKSGRPQATRLPSGSWVNPQGVLCFPDGERKLKVWLDTIKTSA
jgi:hypothetical protein